MPYQVWRFHPMMLISLHQRSLIKLHLAKHKEIYFMQIILCFSHIFRSNSAKMKSIDKKTKIWLFAVPLIILAGSTGLLVVKHSFLSGNQTPPTTKQIAPTTKQIPSTTTFIASIDTMKESRD